jgi:nicotinate-nucleotide adenylyltransferase
VRIGLFGGTFNPIHNGHLNLAKEAKAKLNLDKVIFIPSYIPPHKSIDGLTGAEDRIRMIELAIGDTKGFEISRYEIEKKEKSYSINTVEYFKAKYPDDTKLFFLIGEDSSDGLASWKDANKLFKLCRFVAFNRPGFQGKEHPGVKKVNIEPLDISSTRIRKAVKDKKSTRALIPVAVEDYIKSKNLYK